MSHHDTLTLREALRSIQYEAASLADAQVIALQALNATYPARAALSATQPAQAAQGEPLCDDEGCDHHGTPHVCVNNKQPAQGAGEVVAWCTPDGERCVTARTYEGARKDGGAMWSSMVPFTVPAYTQPATGAVVPDMVEIMALADSYRNATCHEATASAREWLRAAIAASGRQE